MVFASDNFDGGTGGSSLAGRVSSGGQTWSANLDLGHTGEAYLYPLTGASTKLGQKNSLPDSSALYYLSGDPPSADYGVNFDFIFGNNNGNNSIGVLIRFQNTTPTATPTYYALWYNGFIPRWEMRYNTGSGPVAIGLLNKSYSVGQTVPFTFRACGTTIELLESGVSILSVSDSHVSGIGHAGIIVTNCNTLNTNTDGWWIDNFEGDSTACNPFPTPANMLTSVSTWEG